MTTQSFIARISITLLVIIAILSCNNNSNSKAVNTASDSIIPNQSNRDFSIPGSFSTQSRLTFDSNQIKIFLDSFSKFKPFENDIYSFYKSRNFAYAWFDENGLIEPAHNLYNRIQNITEEGIPDKLYYKENFSELLEASGADGKASYSLELMLTTQYLEYAKNVWQGISEKQTKSIEWLLPRKKISYRQLLDSLTEKNILENEPLFPQYHLLKTYLKQFNSIKLQNNFQPIKSDKKLQQGDSSLEIKKIRQWLFAMGDMDENNQSPVFDFPLLEGVKKFQYRFGLKEDGIIGQSVIAEINYPIEKRIEAIMVNMERCRWVPSRLQKNYLLVNIPEYKLHIIDNDSLAFSMNVVVGKSQNKTVIFNGDLKYIVFSPYWNLPASIIKKETLPAIRRNPNYLAKHNMEWNGGNIRQKPGPNNSLGLVKFLFPNTHSIYLHDTPSKPLFDEDYRAFSHGCVRVAEPKKLAIYLLRNDSSWNETSITNAMNSGKEKTVSLSKTIPVIIAYFTSWVDTNGKINFRKDVYNRDSRLAKLIIE